MASGPAIAHQRPAVCRKGKQNKEQGHPLTCRRIARSNQNTTAIEQGRTLQARKGQYFHAAVAFRRFGVGAIRSADLYAFPEGHTATDILSFVLGVRIEPGGIAVLGSVNY